jgi:hypothetical protein
VVLVAVTTAVPPVRDVRAVLIHAFIIALIPVQVNVKQDARVVLVGVKLTVGGIVIQIV